jgi:hypothetical protein
MARARVRYGSPRSTRQTQKTTSAVIALHEMPISSQPPGST